MQIDLRRRYPDSRLEDVTDAYSRGFSIGYDMGYYNAMRAWEKECQQLRDALRAMIDSGEATERARNDSELG